MAKRNLPARIRKEIERVEDVLLPSTYKAPTDPEVIDKARKEYFTIDDTGSSYSSVCEDYLKPGNGTSKKEKKPEKKVKSPKTLPEKIKEETALQLKLSRDSLSEYRKEHGLDKLKEMLIQGIVNFASFEEGLESLSNHIQNNIQLALKSETEGIENFLDKNSPNREEKALISAHYPNITADEVTWFSLLKPLKKSWIFDNQSIFYYPQALVDMDSDGLLFSYGTIEEGLREDIRANSPQKIGGITGADNESDHYNFIHNISQAIKAIMLLNIEDKDVFDRILQQEDIIPFMHGDAMLLRSFLKIYGGDHEIDRKNSETLEEIINNSKNTFSKKSIPDLRKKISEYLNGCKFRNKREQTYSVLDSVKLLGILSRSPKFIEKAEIFDGYVMFYANNVEFINSNGTISDSIPLADYLMHKMAYQFHDRIVSIDQKEQLVREIYEELRERIKKKNIKENNKMALDELQEKMIAEFGIFIPIEVYSRVKEADNPVQLYLRHSSDNTYVDRTVKFGYKEIKSIYEILNKLPKSFTSKVSSVSKKVQNNFGIEMFRNGLAKGGDYDPKNHKIRINIPISSPIEKSLLEFLIKNKKAKSKKGKEKVIEEFFESKIYESYITRIFLHELGESIRENMNPEIWNHWISVSPEAMGIKHKERDKYFLSTYSTTDPNEDFCETFAAYTLFGREFKSKARKYPALKAKYDFMKKLFSYDGVIREFPNRYPCPMHIIVGDPKRELKKIGQESMLLELREREKSMDLEERYSFRDSVLSYENDVQRVIEEYEAKGESISQEEATDIAITRNSELNEETEEHERKSRIYDRVYNLSSELLIKAGADIFDVAEIYDDFAEALFSSKKNSIDYLISKGTSKSNARKIVNQLYPIFQNLEEELRNEASRRRVGSDERKNAGRMARALYDVIKKI